LATDFKDLADLTVIIRPGRDNEGTIEQINGETMRGSIVGSTDLGDSSVSSHYHNRGLITFESSVKEREALDIKHMNLIDEKDTGHDFSAAFFTPFSNFLINLVANFGLNFSDITSKEGHETLTAGVDDINLMEGNSVDNFLTLLELSFGALNKASLGSNVIVV